MYLGANPSDVGGSYSSSGGDVNADGTTGPVTQFPGATPAPKKETSLALSVISSLALYWLLNSEK